MKQSNTLHTDLTDILPIESSKKTNNKKTITKHEIGSLGVWNYIHHER